MEIIRGTTPTHSFKLPVDYNAISNIRVIYSQDNRAKVVKTIADMNVAENECSYKLTQEETFRFKPNEYVNIQVRILTAGNDALASDIDQVMVCPCLENEVIE